MHRDGPQPELVPQGGSQLPPLFHIDTMEVASLIAQIDHPPIARERHATNINIGAIIVHQLGGFLPGRPRVQLGGERHCDEVAARPGQWVVIEVVL